LPSTIGKIGMRTGLLIGIVLAGFLGGSWTGEAAEPAPVTVAVAGFDFVDSAGEAADQASRHAQQIAAFEEIVGQELAASRKFAVKALSCGQPRCTMEDPGVDRLAAAARSGGARYLLVGSLHKMSTLIGWAKLVIVDLDHEGRVCDRLLTYRGDTAEAWRHAAGFSARNLLQHCFP
jgi:hypothetical protein